MKTENSMVLQETSAWERVEALYQAGFYQVAKYVRVKGGSLADAKDVFHDALVIMHHDLLNGKVIASDEHYVFGISRNLWRLKMKERTKASRLPEEVDVPDRVVPSVNEMKLIQLLKKTGSRCMDLLSAMYYGGASIQTIGKRFGFSSEHSASVQKYKCIEKIRETIKTKSIAYEDLFD